MKPKSDIILEKYIDAVEKMNKNLPLCTPFKA